MNLKGDVTFREIIVEEKIVVSIVHRPCRVALSEVVLYIYMQEVTRSESKVQSLLQTENKIKQRLEKGENDIENLKEQW